MENRWIPCFCTMVLGILVIVFTWWTVSWGQIALTVLGALVIIKGLVNKCCCEDMMRKRSSGGGSCCS